MRRGLRYGVLGAGALLAACVLVAALGALVRARVASEAAKHKLEVTVGAVRPGMFAIRLLDVEIHPDRVESVTARIGELRIEPLTHERIVAKGVSLDLVGRPQELRDCFEVWQESSRRTPPAMPPGPRHSRDIAVEGMSVSWADRRGEVPRLAADDMGVTFDGQTARVTAAALRLRFGAGAVTIEQGAATVKASGEVVDAHARSASVEWTTGVDLKKDSGLERADDDPDAGRVANRSPDDPSRPRALQDTASGNPVLPLSDLRRIWGLGATAADRAGAALSPGFVLRVDAFTWKATPSVGVPFTVGPGRFTLERSPSALETRFSTGDVAGDTPLSLLAELATADGDDVLSLEGGPIALSTLGVREGAAGLVDVARTTISGRVRVVLNDHGGTLTFAGEGGVTGLSISDPKIAPDLVRGLGLSFHAHGAATSEGDLRFDDFGAAMGFARVEGSGHLQEQGNRLAGAIHFDVPATQCRALVASVPDALLPALQGTEMAGTFAAHGQVEFDTRDLDQLVLDYDIRDLCRLTRVPPQLARSRFQRSFVHQVYLPDGSIEDTATGPGTDAWTPIEDISPYMPIAVMTTEDGAFMSHHGFSRTSIRSSIIANLKTGRFVRGASTITMQLAKNLFLVRDKTISRKLEEVVLTDYLEQTFSKRELMELYLNVIEFGPTIYGVGAAADYYFGRTPAELNLSECIFLASLLPAPVRYGAMRAAGQVPEGWLRLIHGLVAAAHRNGRITDAELAEAEQQPIVFWQGGDRPTPRAPIRSRPGPDATSGDGTTAPSPESPDGP
jgi:hypothetical protein